MLKKVLIIMIIILILIIVFCSSISIINLVKKENNKDFEENINNIEVAKAENNTYANEENINANEIEKNSTESTNETKTEIKPETSTTEKNTSGSTQENKKNSNSITQESHTASSNPQTESKKEDNNTSSSTENNNPNNGKENTEEQNAETFKVNYAIIERMKNIINSNQSANMQKFGYEIVVDSSIIGVASGFTFSEQRVINAVHLSFGPIKIYARDYYVGNELRWTECFIL